MIDIGCDPIEFENDPPIPAAKKTMMELISDPFEFQHEPISIQLNKSKKRRTEAIPLVEAESKKKENFNAEDLISVVNISPPESESEVN